MTDACLPPPEPAARVRTLYAAGCSVRAIRAETGLSNARIYYWLDHDIGADGLPRTRPLPRRRHRQSLSPEHAAERRRLLAQRIWHAAEAQVSDIEARMAALEMPPGQAERDVRALAVLARVVRDLTALDAAPRPPQKAAAAPAPEDEHAFSDRDTFRRELARRLDALRGEGAE
ncbi:MAG: hypothetical protein AB1698_01960 [Pseudomonadota bacterium]